MFRQWYVCFLYSILALLSCNRANTTTDSSKLESGIVDSTTTDVTVNIELMYRFEGDSLAKELQQLFSKYYSTLVNGKNQIGFFNTHSLEFMVYPPISQNMSIFHDGHFFKIHKPMIIGIYTQNNDTIVKLNFTRVDSTGIATSLATVNFGVTRTGHELRLGNMVQLNSRDWKKVQVKHIEYFFPKSHIFSLEKAKKMQDFNLHIARLFEIKPIEFKYFVCESNIKIKQLQGFDYAFDMFNMNNNSGLSDPTNKIIYSGNGSEYYPHELIHLYTSVWVNGLPRHEWFEEGLATYLGGSRDKPLDWHVIELLKYLEKNGSPDISHPFSLPPQISENTGTIYVIGGVLCKIAFEQGGMDAIRQLFKAGNNEEDFYKIIEEVLGIKRGNLNDFLYEYLNNYKVVDNNEIY